MKRKFSSWIILFIAVGITFFSIEEFYQTHEENTLPSQKLGVSSELVHPEPLPKSAGQQDCSMNGTWFQENEREGYQSGLIDCDHAVSYNLLDGTVESITGASTFEKGYISDDNGTYFALNVKSCGGAPCEFRKISPKTRLQIMNNSGVLFASDGINIFYNGIILKGATKISDFIVLNDTVGGVIFRNSDTVWFDGQAIEGADSRTFKIISGSEEGSSSVFASDKKYCYHLLSYGGDSGVIPECIPENFRTLGKEYSTDGKSVFLQNSKIEGANPLTFRLPQ
ncbi:MAG: hypothetical protein HHAS10_02570 [Candidatus Altimarinota bacterium]